MQNRARHTHSQQKAQFGGAVDVRGTFVRDKTLAALIKSLAHRITFRIYYNYGL